METYEPPLGYRGALLWDSLFHILRTEYESILLKVVNGLTPGGRIMLTVGGSAHPAFPTSCTDRNSFTTPTLLKKRSRCLSNVRKFMQKLGTFYLI
jgi:hypothetical protein